MYRLISSMLIVNLSLLSPSVSSAQSDATLQYDDGTVGWLVWNQTYRATWFHLDDFYTEPIGFEVEKVEFWFYHSSAYGLGWVSDLFMAELWNGGSEGPENLLDSSVAMAVHFSAAFLEYPDPVTTGENFWFVAVLDSTWNGTPSPITDMESSYPAQHCFYSSDMEIWEPVETGEYLFRMHGNPLLGLESTTWGSIKTVF
jgi:hypothetical protein